MPYTPAHAIAAAPVWYLSGKRLPLPALVIGSVAPDFPYFLALTPVHAPGHSLNGLLLYCLVPSMLVLGVWLRWLERPMLALCRIPPGPRPEWTWAFVLLASAAVLLGAATHVVWDSTSHATGWLVQMSPSLRQDVAGLPIYKWIQYLGGILGLAGLSFWYAIGRPETADPAPPAPRYRAAAGIFPASILLFVCVANIVHGSETFTEFAVRGAVGAVTGFAVGAIVYSGWVNSVGRKAGDPN